jgi:hypothetical protein
MRKTYKVRIAFGDGKPVEDEITAKNGLDASDLAKVKHPGARVVHILGLAEDQLADDHPFFSTPSATVNVYQDEEDAERKLRWCLELRSQGNTHSQIAGILGVGKTTVGRWIKQYG